MVTMLHTPDEHFHTMQLKRTPTAKGTNAHLYSHVLVWGEHLVSNLGDEFGYELSTLAPENGNLQPHRQVLF